MKRFFLVFSVILIIFLIVAAGSIAAVEYGSIKVTSTNPVFVAGWGITLIPYSGGPKVFPSGDVILIMQAAAQDVRAGDVILYSGGMDWLMKSGYVAAATDEGFSIVRSDGAQSDIAADNVKGLYKYRIPHMAEIFGVLESMPAIGIFAALLAISIVLWCVLPGRRRISGSLSESDGDIATNLY